VFDRAGWHPCCVPYRLRSANQMFPVNAGETGLVFDGRETA
jgi:hypothetical protein